MTTGEIKIPSPHPQSITTNWSTKDFPGKYSKKNSITRKKTASKEETKKTYGFDKLDVELLRPEQHIGARVPVKHELPIAVRA